MSILFFITAILAAVWLIAIFITRYLMKQAQESVAKQYAQSEKKSYTWAELGVPDELVKEMEEWHRYCKEKGIDPRPRSPEEMEKSIERSVESMAAYWVRLKNLRELVKDVVIQSYALTYGEKTRLEDGREAVRIVWNGGMMDNPPDGYDKSRSNALFVIEERVIEKSIYRRRTKIRMILRRLNADETYDPNGELLLLEETLSEQRPRQAEPIGQMNYDRTALTRTLLIK